MAGGNVVRFGGTFDTKPVEAGIHRIESGMSGMEKKVTAGFSKIGSGIATGIKAGVAIAAVGIAAFASQVAVGLQSLIKLESATAQTNAVIKSTGGAAGITAGQVRSLAEKFEGLNATMDDKVIQSAENMLLTFTAVNKQAFEPALSTILDMNAAMGGGEEGLQSTVIQVGKALQDPIKGITALRKVGVSFTEDQQKVIKKLVETGDLLGAQRLIIKELDREFGGSFLAGGTTTAGKVAKFKDAIEDAQAALARGFLPVLSRVADAISKKLSDPAVLAKIEEIGNKVAGLFSEENIAKGEAFVARVWDRLSHIDWEPIKEGFRVVAEMSGKIIDAFLKLPPAAQSALIGALIVNKLSGGLILKGAGEAGGGGIEAIIGHIAAGATHGVVGAVAHAALSGGGTAAEGAATAAAGASLIPVIALALTALATTAVAVPIGIELRKALKDWRPTESQAARERVEGAKQAIVDAQNDTNHTLARIGLDDQRRGEREGAKWDTISRNTNTSIEKLEQIRLIARDLPGGIATAMSDTLTHISRVLSEHRAGEYDFPASGPTSSGSAGTTLPGGIQQFQTGFLGMFNRPTHAIFGEAGQETLAILRNPRRGMLPQQGAPTGDVNVYVSIDNKHIIKRTRRAEVWHSVVAQ